MQPIPPTLPPTNAPTVPPPTEYDLSDGFCGASFQLNGNRLPNYPRYLSNSQCALQLVADGVSTTKGSAFVPMTIVNNMTFSTTIEYRMHGTANGQADGMTFVMHQDTRGASAIGGTGSELGVYGVYGTEPIKPALVVEMDNCKCRSVKFTCRLFVI
mmetsp:Transcript_4758/g.7351  ORF Transcript_4758/g.7351 Transcript_4758/m.7351 type:complete len:157 (+) Transcript_4758:984-1454(+)